MAEVDDLYNELELLNDQRVAGELGWDEATDRMNKLRAEHPEAAALLRREAEKSYRRTGARRMALDEAATRKDQALHEYRGVLRADALAVEARRALTATLARMSEAERAELDPAIPAIVAAPRSRSANPGRQTRR